MRVHSNSPSGLSPQSHALILNAMGSIPQAAMVIDPATGTILAANSAAIDLCGCAPGEVMGLPFANLLGSGEEAVADLAAIESMQVFHTLWGMSGRVFPTELTLSPWIAGKKRLLTAFIRESRPQTQSNSKRLQVIGEVARELTAILDLDRLKKEIIHAVRRVTGCYCANLFLEKEGKLVFAWGEGGYVDGQLPIDYVLEKGQGIIGRAGLTNRPLIVPDVTKEPGYVYWEGMPHTRSELAVPINSKGEVIGILDIESDRIDAFDETDAETLSLLGNQLSIALENSRLFEQIRQKTQELESLMMVTTSLRQANSRKEMLNITLNQLLLLFGADRAAYFRFIPRVNEIVFDAAQGEWAHLTEQNRQRNHGEPWHLFALGQPYFRSVLDQKERVLLDCPWLGEIDSLACIPLTAQGVNVGYLLIGSSQRIKEEKLSLMVAVSNIAASSLYRLTLFDQTERHLKHVQALHAVDMAIASSFNIQSTLNILVTQILERLMVDAATVLVFNTDKQVLEFAAGRGFRTNALRYTQLSLGEGYAGKAAQELRTIHIADLEKTPDGLVRAPQLRHEEFVTYFGVPLTAKGKLKGVMEIFHRRHLEPDTEWWEFMQTIAGQAAIAIDNADLFNDLEAANAELIRSYDATIEGWSLALELRDHETQGHSRRVTDLTITMARLVGVAEPDLIHIRRGALLHDIGKMAIADAILLKPGKLSESEWVIMKQHPVFAYRLLSPIAFLQPALDIPYCHHEKWDGSGYPRGLKGKDIPLSARIFALVDVWDALRSDRPYRKAVPEAEVRSYMQEISGSHFDPDLVPRFFDVVDHFQKDGMV